MFFLSRNFVIVLYKNVLILYREAMVNNMYNYLTDYGEMK